MRTNKQNGMREMWGAFSLSLSLCYICKQQTALKWRGLEKGVNWLSGHFKTTFVLLLPWKDNATFFFFFFGILNGGLLTTLNGLYVFIFIPLIVEHELSTTSLSLSWFSQVLSSWDDHDDPCLALPAPSAFTCQSTPQAFLFGYWILFLKN